MELPTPLHSWELAPRDARALQVELAGGVRLTGRPKPVRRVAGLDMAIAGEQGVGAAVLLDFPDLQVLQEVVVIAPLRMPYIPGLLSFRELPVLLQALAELVEPPDLLLVDGQGVMHPRRFGLGAHLGVWLDMPVIGCAKSRLCGEHAQPGRERGAHAPVVHRREVIGSCLRTRAGVRPMFISPGHRLHLAAARELCLACTTRYRMPQPTRLADALAAARKRELRAAS